MRNGEGIIEKSRRTSMALLLVAAAAVMALCAPPAAAQQTSVFTYYGDAMYTNGSPADGNVVTIRNVTRDDTIAVTVGDVQSGKYQVTLFDFQNNNAAAVGDEIELVLADGNGTPLAAPVVKVLTALDVTAGSLRTDFTVGNAGVVVVAPGAEPVGPGQQATFDFTVFNIGDIADTYDLTVTNMHPEWLEPHATTVGPIAAGGNAVVSIVVNIPPYVSWTTVELVTLEACSQFDPGVCAQDVTHAAVAVSVTASEVRYVDDHVEVRWTVSDEALGLPFQLHRRRVPETRFVPLVDADVTIVGNDRVFRDGDVERGVTYDYMVEIRGAETFAFPLGRAAVPAGLFRLEQNVPNPFNPSTRIRFELERPDAVTLVVYDVAGRAVRTLIDNRYLGAHAHTVEWDGTDDAGAAAPSGIYFYRLEAGGKVLSRRMVLLK